MKNDTMIIGIETKSETIFGESESQSGTSAIPQSPIVEVLHMTLTIPPDFSLTMLQPGSLPNVMELTFVAKINRQPPANAPISASPV